MVTIYAKLLAKEHDLLGYTNYVFQNLDEAPFGKKYILTTRWPNWDHRNLEIGEIGYLTYNEVQAGVDKWWDGSNFVPYNYSNIIFIKFIKNKNTDNSKEIML